MKKLLRTHDQRPGNGLRHSAQQLLLAAGIAGALLCAQAGKVHAQAYNINTVAGDGAGGYTGDGGAALSAEITAYYGIAVHAGSYYIASSDNYVVRTVNGPGIITTFAGNGTFGYSGDGGAATAAQMKSPIGVASDGFGNIYIADKVDNRVRKVSPTGIITTIAGSGTPGYTGDTGPATAATLSMPVAIAIDGPGNVYIADQGNNVIRVVNLSGIINTYAGTGTAGYTGDGGAAATAEMNAPAGVAADGAGNLYIADEDNNVIRKVNSLGTISTYAGASAGGYNGDGPATASALNAPSGVAVTGSNLFIADMNNNMVREVDPGGNMHTIAGIGYPGFGGDGNAAPSASLSNPAAVALDAMGDVYIADYGNFRVRELTPTSSLSLVSATIGDTIAWQTMEPFNTAMIYYGSSSSARPPVSSAIMGVAWDAGTPIYVHDIGTGLTATVNPITSGSTPDVVIGNNTSTPGDFIMAVAYVNSTNSVEVDYYDITGAGTGSLAISYHTSGIYSPPGVTMYDSNIVHIDLIAEHTTPPALPTCNKFVIVWDQPDLLSTSRIFVAEGSLSAYTSSFAPVEIANGHIWQPDVAAIQRTVGVSMTVDDIALIPYIDYATGALMYAEYDFTALSASSSIMLDGSAFFQVPRIDANDDYTTNSNASVAQYKIAASASAEYVDKYDSFFYATDGYVDIRTYDNLLSPGSGAYFPSAGLLDLSGSGYPTGPYCNVSPVVALMSNNQFGVFHWTDYNHSYPYITFPQSATNIAILESIDRTASYTLSPNNYYAVDSTGVTAVQTVDVWLPATWPISISSPVNWNTSDTSLNLFMWGNFTAGGAVTEYKLSTAGSTLAFRQGAINNAPQSQAQSWEVYPNPATDQLTINNSAGNTAPTQYRITDMAGHAALNGNIAAGNTTAIDICELAPGNYIIEMLNGNSSCGTAKFVKN